MGESILQQIFAARRRGVATAEAATPLESVQRRAEAVPPPRDFARALRTSPFALIAEVKKASPSRGLLRADLDPVQQAQSYVQGGADALSVVTEPDFFRGEIAWLKSIRAAVSCPLLQKDFVFSEYQIWEARAAGADAILLILAALSDGEARFLLESAARAGLAALVEVHNEAEAQQAVSLGAQIIGVNNRDLATFRVSLDVSRRLAPKLPPGAVKVSESGITAPADCADLRAQGFDAFLIGEALVRAENPALLLRQLRNM